MLLSIRRRIERAAFLQPGARGRRMLCAIVALSLLGAPAASAQATYCEQGTLIVAQVESAGPVAGWAVETSLPGFTGASYLRWVGGNQFANPGQGILTYTLKVTTPGTYQMRLRNLHDNPDPTVENDCWARMDGGSWIKIYSPNTSPDWNWGSFFDPGNVLTSYVLSAGTHTFQISGRSNNFRIDRVHFFIDGTPFPQNLSYPESLCPQTWTNLGQGKSGTGGLTPTLGGTGTLVAGSPVALTLAQARANSLASLVIGLGLANVPFKGGIMVPQVTYLISGLPTSPTGGLALLSPWPAGVPANFSVYFQYWVVDPVATQGLSASNGLKGTTP